MKLTALAGMMVGVWTAVLLVSYYVPNPDISFAFGVALGGALLGGACGGLMG